MNPEISFASQEASYRPRHRSEQEQALAEFTPEEQSTLRERIRTLGNVGRFIGKDYDMPIELGKSGKGWYWNFKDNLIRADAKEVLERSLDESRFIIGHEGTHRRISHFDPEFSEMYQKEPGFSVMGNTIEDPRVNNYLTDGYPIFANGMESSYQTSQIEQKRSELATHKKLGYTPRHAQAGWEYIRQWYRDYQELPFEIDDSLPPEVQEVIQNTLPAAQEAWWSYPSREEANDPKVVERYASKFCQTLTDQVWPEFKKLVEMDLRDQELADALREAVQRQRDGQGNPFDNMTEEEQQQLGEAIAKSLDEHQQAEEGQEEQVGPVVDLDSLPDSIKEKIREHLDQLPEEEKQKRREQAAKALQDLDNEINEPLEGKMQESNQVPTNDALPEFGEPDNQSDQTKARDTPQTPPVDLSKMREAMQKLEHAHDSQYDRAVQEVLPIINELEAKLNNIFIERQKNLWQSGYANGKQINIGQRMQERAKGVPASLSRAWERREVPQKNDYAFSLLVDLSGSMTYQGKIEATFKACVAIAEVLAKLGITFEVSGFNAVFHPYKSFTEELDQSVRDRMSTMIDEASSYDAHCNNDGWALGKQSYSLGRRDEKQKFLIVLSDGEPAPDYDYSGPEYDLNKVVEGIIASTDQHLIGIGLQSQAVRDYYPQHVVTDTVEEIPEQLAKTLEDAINQV